MVDQFDVQFCTPENADGNSVSLAVRQENMPGSGKDMIADFGHGPCGHYADGVA